MSGLVRGVAEFLKRMKSVASRGSVSVTTYNVLADHYCTLRTHEDPSFVDLNAEPGYLTFPRRQKTIQEHALAMQPDIVCLQEVDVAHWERYRTGFHHANYSGLFAPKRFNKPDGVALFVNNQRFLIQEHHIAALSGRHGLDSAKFDQVALLTKLRHLITNELICVVTTHLKSNFSGSFESTRAAQAALLMDEIEAFSPLRDDLPLLLCGDFNSTSAESVYELLTTGEATLSAPHDETKSVTYAHPRRLRSAYSRRPTGEPSFTCYVRHNVAPTIDFIFHSPHFLPAVWTPVPEIQKIPNEEHPSDHVPLHVLFSLGKHASKGE